MKAGSRLTAIVLLVAFFFCVCPITRTEASADYIRGLNRLHLNGDVPEKGTVESLTYHKARSIQYTARVYLPYGYDPEDKTTAYDLLVILPGASGSYLTYFEEPYPYTGVQIMDELIYLQECRPLIAVTISSFVSMNANASDLMVTLIRALVESVDQNYNTYGNPDIQVELGPDEELRDHYVLAGFCYSADVMCSVLLVPCCDLFSRYGFFSTEIKCNPKQIKLFEQAQSMHPIREIMISAGSFEPKFRSYTSILGDEFEKLGITVHRFTYAKVIHGYADNAFASFYNILLLMFPTSQRQGEAVSDAPCRPVLAE